MMDLLYELLVDSSPIYVYIGIIVSAVCVYQLLRFRHAGIRTENYSYLRAVHAQEAVQSAHLAAKDMQFDRYTWIAHKTKRIETPDDDGDHSTFSFLYRYHILRGGPIWLNLHSPIPERINIFLPA